MSPANRHSPTTGNTLAAFIALAAKANTSSIPPNAPLGGTLIVNGTTITTIGGDVLDTSNVVSTSTIISTVPPPGATIPPDVASMAGGSQPSSYGWAPNITDSAVSFLQVIGFVDNILLDILINGHNNLTSGSWSNLYPATIANTMGTMAAQAIVHRSTSTDSLTHYAKNVTGTCQYNYPISSVDDFVAISLTLILLEIALLLDVISLVVTTDTWMIGPLSSTLGSKARMAGMVNMMQNHIPAAAPREVLMPASLVYSYVNNHYVVPGSCPDSLPFASIPTLKITKQPTAGSARLSNVTVNYDASQQGSLNMAWLGAWGNVEYTPVMPDAGTAGQGTASVPTDLSGHVWGVLTNGTGAKVQDLPSMAVAGPEIIWVSQP